MEFNLILPLEQQVLVTMADTIWDSQYMDRLVMNCTSKVYVSKDYDVEEVVDETMRNVLRPKIKTLSLPDTIRDKLIWIARNVGLQKINFYFHHEYLWKIRKLPKIYHWTSRGSIDKKKTAEYLVKDDTIDICGRYSLACFYCFEEEIQELSGKLSSRDKLRLCDHGNELSNFWYGTTIKKGRKRKHEQSTSAESQSPYEDALWVGDEDVKTYKQAYKYSLEVDNSVAAEYFWSKLTATEYSLQEREQDRCKFLREMLVKYNHSCYGFRPKEYFLDVALFLLKQMTKDQQMEALTVDPHLTLELFLDWPLQCMLFEAVEILCPHASTKNLSDILCGILERIRISYKGFDYRELFTRFWGSLPESQKVDVINYSIRDSSSLLHDALQVEFFKGFFLIVRAATATQKQELINSIDGLRICEAFIVRQEWGLLKLFIDICLPSTVLNLKFKKDLKRYIAEDKINYVCKILGIPENVGN